VQQYSPSVVSITWESRHNIIQLYVCIPILYLASDMGLHYNDREEPTVSYK
jgi:hypothetical protein